MNTKNKKITLEGFIIKEEVVKDYDKKLVILTKEKGKIIVYAHGVKRINSKNLNATSLYTYGIFELAINSNEYYSLESSKIIKFYNDLCFDYENICISSYFLEILNFISYENIESEDKVELLKYALDALIKNKMDKSLIRSVFNLKLLLSEGLLSEVDININDSKLVKYTYDYVVKTDVNKVFSFNIIEKEKIDFNNKVDNLIKKNLDFQSKVLKNS